MTRMLPRDARDETVAVAEPERASGAPPDVRGRAFVVDSDGVGIYVRDEVGARSSTGRNGNGATPFLLLHGLGLSHRSWDLVTDNLLRAGHRVIRMDTRGHGRSDGPDTGYALHELVTDTLAVIEACGAERVHVAGHSLGGTVAVQLALRAPERVVTLSLLGSLIAGQAPPPAFLAWAGELFELLPLGLPALRSALPGTAPYRHQLIDPGLADDLRIEITNSLHAPTFLPENFGDTQAVSTTAPTPWEQARFGHLTAPLLTLDGSEDQVVAGLEIHASEAVPAAHGVVLPGAGHLALLEQPRTVSRHLLEHAASHR